MSSTVKYLLVAVLLAVAAYFVWVNNSGSRSSKVLSDFAITDTASIGRVFIADARGNTVDLVRMKNSRFWSLNDTLKAMPYKIDIILKTFARAGVQSPVATSARDNTLKVILGDNRRVEVYDLDGDWIKTWYVGRSSQNSQGTFAILETPEEGVSSEPFVIEQRGFRGYLTTRFHADVDDWRWSGLFVYPKLEIAEIEVITPKNDEGSFKVEIPIERKENMRLKTLDSKPLDAPILNISTYVESFRQISIATFRLEMSDFQKDSVLNQTPDFIIKVTDLKGNEEAVDIYYKRPPPIYAEYQLTDVPVDPERVFLYYKGELVLGQRQMFDKIMLTRQQLLGS